MEDKVRHKLQTCASNGKDSYGSFRYFGIPDINIVNEDFATLPEHIRKDYSVRKEILWKSESATESDLTAKEIELIRLYNSNNPTIGYNKWPKFKKNAQ